MNIGGLRFGNLRDDTRDGLLASARAAAPSYDHIGSTIDAERWSAPAVRSHHRDVGSGAVAFAAARDALETWVAHTGIGASIEPRGQVVEVGATLLVVLRRGPVYVVAPNRIVVVIDEPRRFGFAYGTLPGHAQRGEESFIVEHLDDDTVRATIRVQARPATIPARLVAPLVLRFQAAALQGYLGAIGAHLRAVSAG